MCVRVTAFLLCPHLTTTSISNKTSTMKSSDSTHIHTQTKAEQMKLTTMWPLSNASQETERYPPSHINTLLCFVRIKQKIQNRTVMCKSIICHRGFMKHHHRIKLFFYCGNNSDCETAEETVSSKQHFEDLFCPCIHKRRQVKVV